MDEEVWCTTRTLPRRETPTTPLTLPDSLQVVSILANVLVVTPIAAYSATYTRLADGTILVTRELVLIADGVSADEYADLEEVVDTWYLDSQPAVIVRRPGG